MGDKHLEAAVRLQQYIVKSHWNGQAIVGPDPVGRIHWRITRFVRSYLPWLPSEDRYTYVQAQAYWINGNLLLHHLTNDPQYLVYVNQCANFIVQQQRSDGAWIHPPIKGRVGMIATVEGAWASLGLIAAYKQSNDQAFLEAAQQWYEFQINQIGFIEVKDGLAIKYSANARQEAIPNVSTMLLWLMAELYDLTSDSHYLKYTEQLINFLEYSQLESGELPYILDSRPHFMCFQYNSFQFVDLTNFYNLIQDRRMWSILDRLAAFLSTGLTHVGSCKYNCDHNYPEVNYWTAALATAMLKADQLGLGNYDGISTQAYQRLLTRQEANGSFGFSDKNYKFLCDTRSYPRYLAMIFSLLCEKHRLDHKKNASQLVEGRQ